MNSSDDKSYSPEYTFEGLGLDGKPILRQTTDKELSPYPLRFAFVMATSTRAAKRIQTLWREANGD